MTLALLVLLLVVATCCAMSRRRRCSIMFYVLSLVMVVAIGCGPVPIWLLDSLQSAYASRPAVEWGKRNAIILLGAGVQKVPGATFVEPGFFSYGRILAAVELYRACRNTSEDCKVLVSGGDPRGHGVSEAKVYQETLLSLGFRPDDVLTESESMNTWQNAQFSLALLRQLQADREVLVTSGFHLKRSALYFAHFGMEPLPVRADYLPGALSVMPLSYNFTVTDFALLEYIGIALYYVYNALDWNAARQQPGEK